MQTKRILISYTFMLLLLVAVGFSQSWLVALTILNLCLISAVMALGVNIQWGYAGLFNVGMMGFAALGGISAVLVSKPATPGAWQAGGIYLLMAALMIIVTIFLSWFAHKKIKQKLSKRLVIALIVLTGFLLSRYFHDIGSIAIEAINPANSGYLGGLDLPIILSWLLGGLLAAVVAWLIGKTTLGLRSDYLAIATLGISEIIIVIIKNEDWLTRGVKNVTGLPRTVPYEINLQQSTWFIEQVKWFYQTRLAETAHADYANTLQDLVIEASSIVVKLCYTGLFTITLLLILSLALLAVNSPWGRMMRAIRDNETAAKAMGKNVVKRHLQVFVIGSAILGIAGAMLTTLDGQFTPGAYNPLRFTFIIWVMVIIGGSGNHYGSVLGAFLIWFVWVQAEPFGLFLVSAFSGLISNQDIINHLMDSAQYMRLLLMGLILLLVIRFNKSGIIPEHTPKQ